MRWTVPFRPDVNRVFAKYHLFDRTINMLRAKLANGGSPCTYWQNQAVGEYGTFNTDATKCYCWHTEDEADTTKTRSQPDRDHFLCMGTGVLEGYKKFGYEEIVFSTPSEHTVSSDSLIIGRDSAGEPDRFTLSSATETAATLDTENYDDWD